MRWVSRRWLVWLSAIVFVLTLDLTAHADEGIDAAKEYAGLEDAIEHGRATYHGKPVFDPSVLENTLIVFVRGTMGEILDAIPGESYFTDEVEEIKGTAALQKLGVKAKIASTNTLGTREPQARALQRLVQSSDRRVIIVCHSKACNEADAFREMDHATFNAKVAGYVKLAPASQGSPWANLIEKLPPVRKAVGLVLGVIPKAEPTFVRELTTKGAAAAPRTHFDDDTVPTVVVTPRPFDRASTDLIVDIDTNIPKGALHVDLRGHHGTGAIRGWRRYASNVPMAGKLFAKPSVSMTALALLSRMPASRPEAPHVAAARPPPRAAPPPPPPARPVVARR